MAFGQEDSNRGGGREARRFERHGRKEGGAFASLSWHTLLVSVVLATRRGLVLASRAVVTHKIDTSRGLVFAGLTIVARRVDACLGLTLAGLAIVARQIDARRCLVPRPGAEPYRFCNAPQNSQPLLLAPALACHSPARPRHPHHPHPPYNPPRHCLERPHSQKRRRSPESTERAALGKRQQPDLEGSPPLRPPQLHRWFDGAGG